MYFINTIVLVVIVLYIPHYQSYPINFSVTCTSVITSPLLIVYRLVERYHHYEIMKELLESLLGMEYLRYSLYMYLHMLYMYM